MAVDRNRFIASAAGTFELLEVFGEHPGEMSLSALATKVGRPKSSVHRGLATLIGIGSSSRIRARLSID
jgi:DNA-binding IclR family transcriptional regulator